MTEEEHIRLVEVGNAFWRQLGLLAAWRIAQMPEHLQDETVAYLQDLCSIYGTDYGKHLERARKRPPVGDPNRPSLQQLEAAWGFVSTISRMTMDGEETGENGERFRWEFGDTFDALQRLIEDAREIRDAD